MNGLQKALLGVVCGLALACETGGETTADAADARIADVATRDAGPRGDDAEPGSQDADVLDARESPERCLETALVLGERISRRELTVAVAVAISRCGEPASLEALAAQLARSGLQIDP